MAIITRLTTIPIEAIRVTDQTIMAAMRAEAAATQRISPTQQVFISTYSSCLNFFLIL